MKTTPNQNDVLFGKGSIPAGHPGNSQFRSIVASNRLKYSKAGKLEKRIIALSIIEEINKMDPPGRFLIEDPSCLREGSDVGIWICVDEEKAISKVTHCLREKKKDKKATKPRKGGDKLESSSVSVDPHPSVASPMSDQISSSSSPELRIHLEEKVVETVQIPLREWITATISSVDVSLLANESHFSTFGDNVAFWPQEVKISLALSSDSYLLPALKIATSLADQISTSEKARNASENSPYLPTSGYDWADRTVVYTTQSPSTNQYNLDPLPYAAGQPPSDPNELQDMLKSIISDTSAFERDSDNDDVAIHNPSDSGMQLSAIPVSKAQILPPNITRAIKCMEIDDHLQRIHLLGVLFYELFSGGKRYSELGNVDRTDTFGDDPLRNIHHNAINFSDALNILDELGSDDEIFGSIKGDNHLDDGGDNGDNAPPTTKRGRSQNGVHASSSGGMQVASVESLKTQGIPISLCNLIGNMLDSANGDLGSDEAYRAMADVRSDLQLMLDKPSKFLHDLDTKELARTGLRLSEALYGREKELSFLRDACRRSTLCNDEFVVISGPSGCGKSLLARQAASYTKAHGGIFLAGKFDQLQQSKPFSALASAFNEYCDILVSGVGLASATDVLSELRNTFGQDACYLVKMIPSLSMLFGPFDADSTGQDCVDAKKRIEYLLCRFVEIISSSSATPVTLFLDDLQWADVSSINVITNLLLSSGSSNQVNRFLFLGCIRDDEMDENHPVQLMISKVQHFGVRSTVIPLACMDKDTVNEMVSDLLCLSPRLTRPLSDVVHHKTKGNPLFVSRLLLSLSKDGLLRLSLSRRRWEWDEEKIQSRELSDDVALFFTNAVGQLSPEVQSALSVLSCFGAATDVSLIEVLERSLGLHLVRCLEMAVAEGFLNKMNGKYCFCHDRIQEASYNMMKPEDRCLHHFQYGLALCNDVVGGGNDALLFTAMDQVNRGGPAALKDASQSVTIATLNLNAGKKAMEMSDFASAASFFDHGISFLRKNNWRDHYELSLQLYENAAHCSFVEGDFATLRILSEQVLTFAQSFEDKLNIMYITVSALHNASRLKESIKKGVSILSQLGVDIANDVSDTQMNALVDEIASVLQGFSNDALLEYKTMTDRSKIIAMKFLAKLETATIMSNPSLHLAITIKIVKLSLDYGMSSMSAIGFLYLGNILAKMSRFQEGYRCVNVASALVDRFGSKEVASEVIAFSNNLASFVRPVQTTLDSFLQGHTIAMEVGDISNACLSILFFCTHYFWVGSKLADVVKKIDRVLRYFKQHNHLSYLACISPQSRSVLALIGKEESCTAAEQEIQLCSVERSLHGENSLAALSYHFHKAYLSFVFRRYDEMVLHADRYFGCDIKSKPLIYASACQRFIGGLISFWIFRRSKDAKWAERGSQILETMREWAASCDWNFSNKMFLLEAEELYSNARTDLALASYDRAIASAKQHKFVNDEALACELAGHFLLEVGSTYKSIEYFARAHGKLVEWGAIAKAIQLYEFVQGVIPDNLSHLTGLKVSPIGGDIEIEDKSDRKRLFS